MKAMPVSTTDESARDAVICRRLRKGFGDNVGGTTVLNNVSFSIPRGAVLGLIGRNGAGKTTLIRILVGLLMPDAGEAIILGEPALRMTDASKARLGYVPQQPESLNWLSVGQMLDFIGGFYPQWDQEYVMNSLLRWGISPARPLATLSPGERQRVALIRAMALQPALLILDEPAAALDPVARRDLLREIALRAGEAGTTVLFSTHIVSDLERVASHVCFLHEGKLLLDASMDDLKETHARVILPRAAAAAMTARIPGELARRRRPDGSLSMVLTRAVDAPWPIEVTDRGGIPEALSLEDLFIEVTGDARLVWGPM